MYGDTTHYIFPETSLPMPIGEAAVIGAIERRYFDALYAYICIPCKHTDTT